jgi:hypothetical protein
VRDENAAKNGLTRLLLVYSDLVGNHNLPRSGHLPEHILLPDVQSRCDWRFLHEWRTNSLFARGQCDVIWGVFPQITASII